MYKAQVSPIFVSTSAPFVALDLVSISNTNNTLFSNPSTLHIKSLLDNENIEHAKDNENIEHAKKKAKPLYFLFNKFKSNLYFLFNKFMSFLGSPFFSVAMPLGFSFMAFLSPLGPIAAGIAIGATSCAIARSIYVRCRNLKQLKNYQIEDSLMLDMLKAENMKIQLIKEIKDKNKELYKILKKEFLQNRVSDEIEHSNQQDHMQTQSFKDIWLDNLLSVVSTTLYLNPISIGLAIFCNSVSAVNKAKNVQDHKNARDHIMQLREEQKKLLNLPQCKANEKSIKDMQNRLNSEIANIKALTNLLKEDKPSIERINEVIVNEKEVNHLTSFHKPETLFGAFKTTYLSKKTFSANDMFELENPINATLIARSNAIKETIKKESYSQKERTISPPLTKKKLKKEHYKHIIKSKNNYISMS